jgi:multidrug resistance protein MdtO
VSTATAVPSHAASRPRPLQPEGRVSWALEFLRRELAPYPGRLSTVTRMVLAATLTMLIIMTFHLPAGALGGYFALIISRESLGSTAKQTWLTIVFFCLGTVYVMLGIAVFVDSPVTHFLWVIGSFYLIFFVMGTARNYSLAAGFSFLIATVIPIWDRAGEVNLKVALTLYILLSVVIGTFCTLFVELVYRSFHPVDPVIAGIADRLHVAAAVLKTSAHGRPPPQKVQARLQQYAMVGPSILRQQIIRSGISESARARSAAVVSMSGRMVELCAAALEHAAPRSPTDNARLQELGAVLEAQASAIRELPDVSRIGQGTVLTWEGSEAPSASLPILPEIARSVRLLSEIFNSFGYQTEAANPFRSGASRAREKARTIALLLGARPSDIFVEDAFTNRDHLVFALRGCLAASLCYIIYTGIDWPGINTSVATCIITALGTIGSSRQKQALRIGGAIVGGFLISIPAQVFLLPLMDSINSFTFFFAAVSAIAAWFATSSPRLSYFGLQIALAFYLVNLQEPFEQISLAVARDRVVGVLLGLIAMWLVFDQIAAPLATVRMETLLRTNLNLMGDLGCAVAGVWAPGATQSAANDARNKFRRLRDKINDTFSQMNAQADAVPFEFGRKRAQKLRQRERMQTMQPAMRSVFLLEITLFESDHLPHAALDRVDSTSAPMLQAFLDRSRVLLRSLAALPQPGDRISPGSDSKTASPQQAHTALIAVHDAFARMNDTPGERRSGVVTLCAGIVSSLSALERASTGNAPLQ